MVSIPKRDVFATLIVGIAMLVYVAWAVGVTVPGDVAGVALTVLALGVVASVSAVVPAFAELVHGSRLYLGTASALGLAALIAGLWALLVAEPTGLTVLMLATILLWAMSTMRHVALHKPMERLGQG